MGAVALNSDGSAQPSPVAGNRLWTTALVGVVLVAAFTSLGLHQVVINDDPQAFDQSAYLQEAVRIDERGGLIAFPRMVLAGDYQQANQHPLYILAISPFVSHDISALVAAKLVSLFFGALSILVGYLLIIRLFDHLVATLATAGFLLTHLYIKWSTLVACESLLVLLSTVAVYGILRGFADARYWTLAGLFAGLAYLTKVTALLLLPGFAVAAMLVFGRQVFRQAALYKFVLAFLLGCSPLLVQNTIVHGFPVYNTNIANLAGPPADLAYSEKSMARGSMIRIYEEPSAPAAAEPGAGFDAVGTVTRLAGEIAGRLPREFTLFLETLSVWPIHTGASALRMLFGVAILALCLVGASRENVFGAKVYFLSTLLVFLVALSMHRPLPRYWLPITYFVWVYAAVGFAHLMSLLPRRVARDGSRPAVFAKGAVVSLCLLIVAYIVSTKPLDHVMDSVEVPEYRTDLLNWLRDNLQEEDRFVEGPLFVWQLDRGVHLYPPMEVRASPHAFQEFMGRHGVKYVIVDWRSMNDLRFRGGQSERSGGADRREKFSGILEFDEELGIVERNLPPGWQPVAVDQKGRVEYIVYRIDGQGSRPERPSA